CFSVCDVRAGFALSHGLTDGSVQAVKLEGGHGMMLPRGEMPTQGREYFGVDGVEEPLDLASALGPADGGVDDADLQGDRGVFEMVTGEVTSVVDVESVGHAAHRPGRIALGPDRLA